MDTEDIVTLRMPVLPAPRDLRILFGAAVATSCLVAAVVGGLVGRSRAAAPLSAAREPRSAVVFEANEEVTLLPLLAPEKFVAEETEAPPPSPPVVARAARRSTGFGFGHMGSDRAARHASPRRH